MMLDDRALSPVPQTLWHRLLGRLFELLLTPVGIAVQTEPQVMSEPPKADILLLRREGPAWTAAQSSLLPDGIRHSRARHILIEFKATESINGSVLQQVIGYDYFYRQAQQLTDEEVQSFVVSSRKPRSNVLQTYGYAPTTHAGVYQSTNPLLQRIPLLVLNELQIVTHNAFVQCFASRRQVRERAFQLLAQMDWQELSEAFWDFFVGLRTHLAAKGVEMKNVLTPELLTPEIVMETGKELRKALLSTLTPQEVQQLLKKLTPEERLTGLAPEERLAGLAPEERLAGLAPEELATLFAQIELYLRTQSGDKPAPA